MHQGNGTKKIKGSGRTKGLACKKKKSKHLALSQSKISWGFADNELLLILICNKKKFENSVPDATLDCIVYLL